MPCSTDTSLMKYYYISKNVTILRHLDVMGSTMQAINNLEWKYFLLSWALFHPCLEKERRWYKKLKTVSKMNRIQRRNRYIPNLYTCCCWPRILERKESAWKKHKANISFKLAQCFTGYLFSLIHQNTNLSGYTLAEGNLFSFTVSIVWWSWMT